MKYIHIFDPVALDEYQDAVEWYAERSYTAAENFIKSFDLKIKDICDDPFKYRNTHKNFRETSLRNYPYYLVYQIDKNRNLLIVTSIYHHKRNPKGKFNKLKKR